MFPRLILSWRMVAILPALLLTQGNRAGAADRKTPPAKVQPARTVAPARQPSRPQPAPAPRVNGAYRQAKIIQAQQPTVANNSRTPVEQMVHKGRGGWDTAAPNKGVVKVDKITRVDPRQVAGVANRQYKREQVDLARRYPAISRTVPPASTTPQKSTPPSFFRKLFRKN
jgi:hypothetical protein